MTLNFIVLALVASTLRLFSCCKLQFLNRWKWNFRSKTKTMRSFSVTTNKETYCEFYTKSFMLFQSSYPFSCTVSHYLPLRFSAASNLLAARHYENIGFVIKLFFFFCSTFRSSSLILSLLLLLGCSSSFIYQTFWGFLLKIWK